MTFDNIVNFIWIWFDTNNKLINALDHFLIKFFFDANGKLIDNLKFF